MHGLRNSKRLRHFAKIRNYSQGIFTLCAKHRAVYSCGKRSAHDPQSSPRKDADAASVGQLRVSYMAGRSGKGPSPLRPSSTAS